MNNKGFSLIELLVALTIFAFGLIAVASMQLTSIQVNSQANTLSAATYLAQGVLADVMARDASSSLFSTDASDVVWDLNPTDSGSTSLFLSGAGTYSATYSIDADNPTTNVARIDVTVSNGTRTTTLTSFKRAL